MDIHDITRRCGSLPASEIAEQANDTLARHSSLVITAPPGAGKSTLLPLTMLCSLPDDGSKVLMLEPRRIAAKQIAERMAHTLGESVGQTVGYRVRFDSKVSCKTRIEVLTEGILTRMLVDDATLEGVGIVIFDEFHERSLNSDLALALTRQTQQIIRPDLKIVVMSATIDASGICRRLGAPLIESEGRMFPVEVHHATQDTDDADMAQAAASAVVEAHARHEGDILVFLPGQGEIERCREMLGSSLAPTEILPLYGNLPPEQQRRAIAPSRQGERKVVLATPIAETSITIEGVRVVIDTGLCRNLMFDARTGLSHLQVAHISMDMATQRTGRAGRVAQGTCYRLWTRQREHLMEPRRKPEIEEADLAPMVLAIAATGESDAESLPWLEMPPHGNVGKATELLRTLGALDHSDNITTLGKRMAALPCHPRMARMMMGCKSNAMKALACDIAALLEEKDPMADTPDTDLTLRIYALRTARRRRQPGRWQRIAQIAAEYRRMMHADEDNSDIAPEDAGLLIAMAYPERIAKATDGIGSYRLASGDNVRLDTADQQSAYEWLAIASLHTAPGTMGRVFLAARLNPDDLGTMATERDNVAWDTKQGCVTMRHELRIGKLVVSSKPIHDADSQAIVDIICEAMRKDGMSMMAWSDDKVAQTQQRVAQVAAWHPELDIPDISTEHLMATAKDWLPMYLTEDGHTKTTTTELRRMDLAGIIWNIIPYDLQVEIDRLAPSHIEVPTGSHIRVDYRAGAEAPVLSVRLQECFGMQATPCVDGGKRKVLMELLSPGFKPVQLTQDLASFWQNTYFDVRKELRRRYPKHYWPENPLEAEAVRGVKKKGK